MSNYPSFLEDMMAVLCNYYQYLSVLGHDDDPVNIDAGTGTGIECSL